MNEPTISQSDAYKMMDAEGPESNLTILKATNGRFLARNHGLADDGQNLRLTMIGRIIEEPIYAPPGTAPHDPEQWAKRPQ